MLQLLRLRDNQDKALMGQRLLFRRLVMFLGLARGLAVASSLAAADIFPCKPCRESPNSLDKTNPNHTICKQSIDLLPSH